MSETTPPIPGPAAAAEHRLLVSAAPHLAAHTTTRRIMLEVVAAMAPMFVVALYMFREAAIVLTVTTVAGSLVAEALANRIRGRSLASLGDGSALVTGVILAFSLPPSLPPYMAFLGGAVAIALAKAVFGGLGQNLFNPAMVGRAFLMICFPAAMVTWTLPTPLAAAGVDAVSMATPLYAAAKHEALPPLLDLLLGKVGGSLGETSALAALLGGLWLVLRGIADWRPVVGVLGSVVAFATISHLVDPAQFEGPLFHLTSGALMFGAFFIATDYVGAPITPKGRLLFGIGVGAIVMIIRLFGAYPEGVMFAILIMNSLTPLLERWTISEPFGGHVAAP